MKSGSNAGIAVFDYKELILKGINCNCMYVHYFWDRLVHPVFTSNALQLNYMYFCMISKSFGSLSSEHVP